MTPPHGPRKPIHHRDADRPQLSEQRDGGATTTNVGPASRLIDVVAGVDDLPEDVVVFAVRPWTADCEAAAVSVDEDDEVRLDPDNGMHYLLEAPLLCEVIKVWSSWRDGAVPSREQACRAVIHYATMDAWEPVEPAAGAACWID